MTSNTPKRFWNEDAKEALKPYLVRCSPAGSVGALFSKKLRCQCDRCYLNKRIRKGLLARFGMTQAKPERISSIRFGPALLAELASIVKIAPPIICLSIVSSTFVFAIERDNRSDALPITVTIRQEYIIRGASSVIAGVQTREGGQKIQTPQAPPKELVVVPEVIKPRLAPPSNLRPSLN